MFLLFFIAVVAMFVFLIPQPPRRWEPGASLRKRTDADYDLIMRASNWDPEMFYECEDGKYRNARGEIGVKKTLAEMLEEK